jgi:hypothetical protein
VVRVATELSVLGFALPVTADVEPSVDAGSLVFTPVEVTVNGAAFSLDSLRDGPFASFADSVLPAQSFCVAELVPAEITLTGVEVSPDALVLAFDGDGAVVGASDFADPGACG